MGDARFRARWAKQIVAACKRAPEPSNARLAAAIPTEVRGIIRRKGMLDWLDAPDFLVLCDAIHGALDDEARDELWASTLRAALQTPLLAPLLAGGLGIFGKHPAAMMRMTPQAWALLARDVGHAEFERQGTGGVVRFVDLPPHVAASIGFAGALRGYTAATLTWTGHRGHLVTEVTPTSIAFTLVLD